MYRAREGRCNVRARGGVMMVKDDYFLDSFCIDRHNSKRDL